MERKTIDTYDLNELRKEMDKLIEEGWEPEGKYSEIYGTWAGRDIYNYIQVMVKKDHAG